MALPPARTHVHSLGGHADRLAARARFAARRAGRWSLEVAKVGLWLAVVTSSLLAIALLASRGARYGAPSGSCAASVPSPALASCGDVAKNRAR